MMKMVGARYLPSVYYRVRMIPFMSKETEGLDPSEYIEGA